MIRKLNLFTYLLLFTSLLAACGGGSSGGGGTSPATPTQAVVKLSLSGSPPQNTAIAGVGLSITLPANVKPVIVNNTVATDVITPSGTFAAGAQTAPLYTATSGKLQLALVNLSTAGITQVGEVATVILQLSNNAAPSATAFVIGDVNVIDTRGSKLTGMGVRVSSVTLQ